MKFWKKLSLFIVVGIAIVLSFSRFYIVYNNFDYSIKKESNQNTNKNILEKYMLESYIVEIIQNGEDVSNEKIIDYLKKVYSYIEESEEKVALLNEKKEIIYSNIQNIDTSFNLNQILNQNTDEYSIKNINGKPYMIFVSNMSINNKNLYLINTYNIENLYKERDRQLKSILYSDIIIIIFSAIFVCLFSIILTRPINNLNKISKKIANGKFDERLKIESNDEIGSLAVSFNQMADEIENKINELKMKVKEKDDFINGFAHELKTPMTAMVGYADILRLKKCDEDTYRKAVEYIYQETKRLEVLSHKLMKLMSLSEEKIVFKEIDVNTLIQKVLKIEENVVKNKVEVDVKGGTILGDIELLEAVLRNLIENSDNSMPKDKKIIIKGRALKSKKYLFSVIDRGKGIPKEHLNRVKEDFYMVDKSRSRKMGSSGIGLSLVEKILNLHNSKLKIKSKENVGTIAYFVIKEV